MPVLLDRPIRIAMAWDAENVPHHDIFQITNRIRRIGNIVMNNAFADWRMPEVKKWKVKANKMSINLTQVDIKKANEGTVDKHIKKHLKKILKTEMWT